MDNTKQSKANFLEKVEVKNSNIILYLFLAFQMRPSECYEVCLSNKILNMSRMSSINLNSTGMDNKGHLVSKTAIALYFQVYILK